MNIGIIAEGTSDQNVIENILKSFQIESSQVKKLRPELAFDASDRYQENRTFGGWQSVKNDCVKKDVFDKFFYTNENKYIVIQIDTAECEEKDFGLTKPPKHNLNEYSTKLRNLVIEKINDWLENEYSDNLFYAVCIEEIESWILAKYIENDTDTAKSANPKVKLSHIIAERGIKISANSEAEFYKQITKDFGKCKALEKYRRKNFSLNDFVESLLFILGENN